MTKLQMVLRALTVGGCGMAALVGMSVPETNCTVGTAQPEKAEAVDMLLTKPRTPDSFKLQFGNGVEATQGHEQAIQRIEDIIVKAQMRQADIEASPDGHALIAKDSFFFAGVDQIFVWPCWLDADEYFVVDEALDAEFISDRHVLVNTESGLFVIDVNSPEERIAVKTRFKQSCLAMNDNGDWAGITQDNRLLSGSSTDRLVIESEVGIEPDSTSGQRIGWIRNGEFFALICKVDDRRVIRIYRPDGEFTGSEVEGYALLHAPIGADTLFIDKGERRYRLVRVNDNGEFELLNWWSGNNRGLVRPFAVSPGGRMAACWKEGLVPGASSAVIRKTDVGELEDSLPKYPKRTRFAAWLCSECDCSSP